MRLSRRSLVIGGAAAGGLLVGWALMPRHFSSPLTPTPDEWAVDAWLKIGTDGVVTVAVPQLEMGQGVTTILPQIVAAELGADWRQLAVEPAPPAGAYANRVLAARWAPMWEPAIAAIATEPDDWAVGRFAQGERFSATADGTSLAAFEQPCREAAAAARAMLAMAAADRWGVAWEECEVSQGLVRHGDSAASFGELVESARQFDPPAPPPLRPEPTSEIPDALAGEAELAFPRLDLPAKVDGSLLFAGDVRLPGMAYASIRHGPLDRALLAQFDVGKAAGIHGLLQIVNGKRWLAAVADNWWSAENALAAIDPTFTVQRPASSADIADAYDAALRRGSAQRIHERGAGEVALADHTLASRYDVAPAMNFPLETATATARVEGNRCEIWAASQAPERAREAAARALGMSAEDVVIYPVPAGGSFDRRLEHGHVIEAALIAREAGRPVQLVWSRAQEALAQYPRPAVSALMAARTGPQGMLNAWTARIAAPPAAREFGRRLFENRTSWAAIDDVEGEGDVLAMEGAAPPYAIADVAIDHVPVTLSLPSGRMRGNAHGYTCFFTECFIDELAVKHAREPLSYRMEMLGEDIRLATCLQTAARLAQWGGTAGQGLACHRMGDIATGGRIALIAQARLDESGLKIDRMSAAVDIGRIVNLDIARQQIEGGLIYGIALASGAASGWSGGFPENRRLAELGIPRLANSPEIEIEFIASDAAPFDPGELGVAVAAPAIGNALFAATGVRIRRLPLLGGGL